MWIQLALSLAAGNLPAGPHSMAPSTRADPGTGPPAIPLVWIGANLAGRVPGHPLPAPRVETVQETLPDGTRIEYGTSTNSDGDRVRHGKYLLFAPDGAKRVEGEYESGQRSGRWTYFTPEGKTWILGKYSRGIRHGSWSFKGEGKTTLAKGKYKWGAPTGKWTLRDSSGEERTGRFEGASAHHPDGSLRAEGATFEGLKHGPWTFYWPNGQKQLEAEFIDGERTGSWRFWHSDGTEDPRMLRASHGESWGILPEFSRDPAPEGTSEGEAGPPIPNLQELLPLDLPESLEGPISPHARLRFELGQVVDGLCNLDTSRAEAWEQAQASMVENLKPFLRGHRLLPADARPGPGTTGLAIARLHSLYWITEDLPDFWFIDLNHTNPGKDSGTSSLLLHPPLLLDGLQAERNRRGIYGLRFQREAREQRQREGSGTERHLELALQWLVENQDEDGAWLADDPFYSAGVTGLALLALIADGNTLREGPYQESVRRGVSFLLERPHPEFKWTPNPARRPVPKSRIPEEVSWVRTNTFLYTLAILTQVYGELAATCDGPLIRRMAETSAQLSTRFRHPYSVWGYEIPGLGLDDTSLTCWMVAGLLAAERAGIDVDQAYRDDTLNWFHEVTELMFGRAGYRARDQLSSREVGVNDDYPREKTEALTAAALWTRYTLGVDPEKEDVMERSADTLLRTPPEWDEERGHSNDYYYWYYGTYACERAGGSHRKKWNAALQDTLLNHQSVLPEERGSWKNNGPWGALGGRAYSTALGALCLTSSFRYDWSAP